jgi:CheY-like chemotaxis protein
MPRGSADRLVVIRVEDEGEGMDPATQEQIFEPFFTTKDEGSGLGLATVYGIVQQCGGHIEVESALGRGTTFRVLLPESAAAAPRVVERERPTTMCGHETVLVVEDEVLVRSLAKQVLIEAGYTVLEASDGREALEVIEEESRIDLVVTDVVMPRMSGLELAEALREGYPAMPLVFMSGYPHPRRGSGGPRAASVPVLAKPFSTEALLQEVRLVLDSATTVTTTSSDEVE